MGKTENLSVFLCFFPQQQQQRKKRNMKNRHNNDVHPYWNSNGQKVRNHHFYASILSLYMYPAPAYGLSRMMKHHVRLVIFLRDLRMKIGIHICSYHSVDVMLEILTNVVVIVHSTHGVDLFSCYFHAKQIALTYVLSCYWQQYLYSFTKSIVEQAKPMVCHVDTCCTQRVTISKRESKMRIKRNMQIYT